MGKVNQNGNLENDLATSNVIIFDLQKENEKLRDKIAKLEEKIVSLQGQQGQQQDKLEEAKSSAIAELEVLMQGSNGQLAVTADQLLKKLKDDGKLPSAASDWKEYINGASSSQIVADRKDEIKVVIADLQKSEVVSDDLDKIKFTAILNINEALTASSLDEKDIVSDYQGYTKKIQDSTNEQEIKDFAAKVISYLKACQELNDNFKEAKKFVDGEIAFEFKKCHKTRRVLDTLVEKDSLKQN